MKANRICSREKKVVEKVKTRRATTEELTNKTWRMMRMKKMMMMISTRKMTGNSMISLNNQMWRLAKTGSSVSSYFQGIRERTSNKSSWVSTNRNSKRNRRISRMLL